MSWAEQALMDAKGCLLDNDVFDAVVEDFLQNLEVDLQNISQPLEQFLHEHVVNGRNFTYEEQLEILQEFPDLEEKDSGLWDKKDPMLKQFAACADYTFRNVVVREIGNIIDRINADDNVKHFLTPESVRSQLVDLIG